MQQIPPPQMPAKKVNVKLMVAIVLLLLLVPVGVMFCIFPWLSQQAFKSVDEIDAAQVESLSVQLLNHPSGKDDIGPIRMAPEDFARLFEPLRQAEKLEVQPAAAFNGEYKVRFKDGRRGTIRLRWQRETVDVAPAFAAVVGTTAEQFGNTPRWRYTIYMQIGTEKYRAKGDVLALFELARECEVRGEK
jgi:hypothetical protein